MLCPTSNRLLINPLYYQQPEDVMVMVPYGWNEMQGVNLANLL